MQTILPGEPQAELQAVTTAHWKDIRLVVYISGNAIVILSGPQELLQTIYLDQCDELSAVALDDATGNIAACSDEEVYIYKCFGGDEGALRWTLNRTLSLPGDSKRGASLSWGSEEEMLVGTSCLSLYQTTGSGREIWHQGLPTPVKLSLFSPDTNLIASCGWHDRNIKIWRRQSTDPEDTRFDFTYLPHPTAVNTFQWRRPPKHEHHNYEQSVDDVLYSVCADSKVRIWAASDLHGTSHMQLWKQIGMQETLQPRKLGLTETNTDRYIFFIHQDDFTAASQRLLNEDDSKPKAQSHARDHLAEIANMKPDICVVLDRHGNMSAWGLENVGCKARKEPDAFNIAHLQDFDLQLKHGTEWQIDSNVIFLCFLTNDHSPSLSLVIHHFDGRVSWREAKVDSLFDPLPRHDRIQLRGEWTGHRSPIRKLVRDLNGSSLWSCSDDNDALVWSQEHHSLSSLLQRRCRITSKSEIIDACILASGDFLITLSKSNIALWHTRPAQAILISQRSRQLGPGPSFLILLEGTLQCQYVAVINADQTGSLWSCILPKRCGVESEMSSKPDHALEHCQDLKIESERGENLLYGIILQQSHTSGLIKSRGIRYEPNLCVVDTSGTVTFWSIRRNEAGRKVDLVCGKQVDTYIKDAALVSCSRTSKLAIVDNPKTKLSIWDARDACLEYEHILEDNDPIEKLCWSYTANSDALLAVGLSYKVVVLGQIHYQLTQNDPSWIVLRVIHIKDLTSHPIGDVVWLNDGKLAIGAGHQMFVCSAAASMSDMVIADLAIPANELQSGGMLGLTSRLNASHPLYHPEMMVCSILATKVVPAGRIAMALLRSMKYFAPGDELDSSLDIPLLNLCSSNSKIENTASEQVKHGDFAEEEDFDEDNALTLCEILAKIRLPNISPTEQLRLVEIVDCLANTYKLRQAMDDKATPYHFCFKLRKIRQRQGTHEQRIPWKEIVWAVHSSSQDILVDHVVRQYNGRLGWEEAADCGMLLWLTDRKALDAQMEVIARNEYTKTDEKNPIDCSLYYLALKKKNVLLGLWRMATWNREQAGTQKLLKNDFNQSRWKTAALKNAYALLGKRRFEYAAAWFLLAGNLQDAVNVCLNQVGDLQLAIAIARVYGGDDCSVLQVLIREKVLPQAANEGNRWQATWAFTMLGQHDMAIRALMEPLHKLIPLDHPPLLQAHSYLNNEPALIHVYTHLRTAYLQKPKAAFPISSQTEWDFIIRTARTYDRMGCSILALDLVRNWKFVQLETKKAEPVSELPSASDENKKERRKSKRRTSSSTSLGAAQKSPTEEKEKAKPTMFHEPEASSLLDSFGF